MITVLYICPCATMEGSTQSLLDLIESVKSFVKPIVLFSSKKNAYKVFLEHGIECIVFPYIKLHYFNQANTWKQLLFHPQRLRIIKLFRIERACVRKVKEYLGNRSIDIVHSNYSSILIGRELSIALKAKHVWHIREFLEQGVHVPNRPFGGYSLLKTLINRADARIVISHQAQDHWGFKQKNTWIIFDSIANASDCCLNPKKQPYILFCSYYISQVKGALLTVNAFGKSRLHQEGIRLAYVGNCTSEMHSEIADVARNFGCEDAIDFFPYQEEVKPFFANAMAFVMASTNEGLGRVTAEAMFYGCPVIAKASGGTLDLIQNQKTGFLFRSEEECAVLMQQVCHNSQESLIRKAQAFAVNNLSNEVYGPHVMEVYNAVMN